MPGQGPTLEGWKAIANYLRTGIAATPAWLGGMAAGTKRGAQALSAGEPLIPTFVGGRRAKTGKGSGTSAAEEFIRGYEDIPMTSEADLAWAKAVEEGSEALPGSGLPAEFLAPGSVGELKGLMGLLGMGGGGLGVIKAYHGSPNVWKTNPELDRIGTDMSKISSGEGHQAFGYGHYSAESPGTAQQYSEGLSNPRIIVGEKARDAADLQRINDPDFDSSIDLDADFDIDAFTEEDLTEMFFTQKGPLGGVIHTDPANNALQELAYEVGAIRKRNNYGSLSEKDIKEAARNTIEKINTRFTSSPASLERAAADETVAYRAYQSDPTEANRIAHMDARKETNKARELFKEGEELEYFRSQIKTIEDALENRGIRFDQEKHFYGLTHDVNPEDLLDADGLLIDQHPEIRKNFEKVLEKYDVEIFEDYDDLDRWYTSAKNPDLGVSSDDSVISIIHHLESTVFRGEPGKLSKELSDAGIPGLQFWDATSRKEGTGSRNIVMFRDDLTYIDPERTDPSTLNAMKTRDFLRQMSEGKSPPYSEDLPLGKPYRTVGE